MLLHYTYVQYNLPFIFCRIHSMDEYVQTYYLAEKTGVTSTPC